MSTVGASATQAGVVVIDARGHRCPVPSLRLRRALEACPDGAEVELLADDPMARIDIPHLINLLRYQIVLAEYSDNQIMFRVRKSPDPGQSDVAPSS
jgi:tRNA 2-thiouridine synthesizing protein A